MYGQGHKGPALFLGEFFPLPPLRPCRAAAAASTVRAKIRSSLSAIFGSQAEAAGSAGRVSCRDGKTSMPPFLVPNVTAEGD